MAAPRYGDGKPVAMDAYHESRNELDGLPVTVTEKIPVTNTPNIFSYKSYVFAKNPALVRRFIKATKADVGGVGGHVVAADLTSSAATPCLPKSPTSPSVPTISTRIRIAPGPAAAAPATPPRAPDTAAQRACTRP